MYSPRRNIDSARLRPIAATSTATSPGPGVGSGSSSIRSTSGSPSSENRTVLVMTAELAASTITTHGLSPRP